MAQRSKFGEANSKQQILGTARVTRSLSAQNKLIEYADVAELAASSPKRSRWEKKRGEDGAAVKIWRSEQQATNFGNRKSYAHIIRTEQTN